MDRSQAAEIHPLWGRKLNEYTASYGPDTTLDRPHLDSDLGYSLLAKAQEGIRQICELVDDEARTIADRHAVARRIHISTLQSVMNLALSPQTLHLLACPPLIRGCIRVMSTVRISGKPSVSLPHEFFSNSLPSLTL